MPKHAVYIETDQPFSVDDAASIIYAAGINPTAIRAVTPNQDGIILTNLYADGVWNQESGYNDCDGHCEHLRRVHLRWEELNAAQQELFAATLSHFMDQARSGAFILSEHLGESPLFREVLTSECNPD